MKTLMEGDLRDLVQVGIVRKLLPGSRISSELVEAVYDVRRGDEGFQTYYTKIRRAIADLESRGFVSRRLFGRDRPFRLTQLGSRGSQEPNPSRQTGDELAGCVSET